ncbi:MAG: hypothetical protein B7Y62_10265 [Sphingomonadales bacterium 35-56-22]|jgi:uncharacterized protein (DUF885 family)|uniref:DUF885 domain-containing protein n=1 Tax=Sphingorhabdus sp. TaxID=1902408 RepID=UPI000BCB4B8C|nr:DUF885 domain-containing protein [Sphingorhabdus sp.]OYY14597.1 MAG: hypothetical protein B7Y62_10265 [Sphingomonadales bacterium 35-56-22]OYY96662.1 MAG: hypothetical protein B7Y38_10400 [Sphingomonadales bacterium 28-56-43]OYZ61263.1 MAG: hypothetical protein B7Y10_03775 [Sphingomonadales bacterium 24-56-14]OZA83094.1 MAG: hypothetical protein B7X66_04905 [Sphingomonadales bacterium 39-57-19]HQS12545.1 DUF885 domain-containing protein [Sphingorhabdus sp.]
MRKLLLAGSILALAVPAHADANGDLVTLVNDVWAASLKEQPVYASALGVNDYASELGDYTLAAQDRRAADAAKFLTRLNAIPSDSLNAASKVEAGILRRALNSTIEGNSFGQRAINFTTYSSWHQQLAGMAQNLPFRTKADFESYNARLAQYARVNDENIAVANVAIKGKYTQPCVTLKGFEGTISGLITTDVNKSRFYEPYAKKRPAGVSEADFASLAKAAEATIRTVIHPALNKQLAWYTASYKPACATAPGVSAQPGGDKYYAFRVREETTTSLTAEQIHQIGLNEVARIRAEMVEVASQAGYPSREAFIQHLRTDPQYYAKTPEELMEKVARVTKIIDGKMPSLFGRLPRLPYGIKEIPAETAEGTTTAYYNQGSPEIGISGTYFVNTSKLNQRPFWEIPALSVHEGVPGHHHQIALQQELPLSDFRKYGAFFTAFTEGWGLYSERLGIEMGLYDTPAKDMGRLSYEMWRACRLVVDTGIHAKGWSKQQAIDFMTDNSALSAANIEAEVNRYISWPGQALAYKLGELKIRELRTMATKELGPKFNLAAFHDAVLGQGSVPLDVLEQQIKDWVAAEKAKG